LGAIARNRANDYYRHSSPQQQLEEEMSVQKIEAVNSGGDQQFSAVAILDTIRTLSETYRETLILRLVEGMTGPEIAARTGVTPVPFASTYIGGYSSFGQPCARGPGTTVRNRSRSDEG